LTTGTSTHLTGLAIYLDVGDQDWLRQGVLDLHAVMTGAGIAHQWHLNPGSHGDPYWREHTAAYLAWYASHWPEDVAGYPAVDGRSCSP
jgi:enterochelin esterase-like enzyme